MRRPSSFSPTMHRQRSRLASLVVIASAMFIFGGCSGDGEGDSTAPPTETPTPTETLPAASPADLDSYRYAVTVTMLPTVLDTSEAPDGLPLDQPIRIEMEGERVNPDREHVRTSADLSFIAVETETVTIGERRWVREGTRSWQEGGSSALEAFAGMDFRPSTLFADDAGQYNEVAARLQEYDWVEDDRDGIPTRRFTLDQEAFYDLFQSTGRVLPAEVDATLTAEIWLERDSGTPVGLLVVGTDESGEEVLRLDLRLWDLDSSEIEVEPPA